MKHVYVIHMHRYGDFESYSYILGVASSLKRAKELAALEWEYRGCCKYEPSIHKRPINWNNNKINVHDEILLSTFEMSEILKTNPKWK